MPSEEKETIKDDAKTPESTSAAAQDTADTAPEKPAKAPKEKKGKKKAAVSSAMEAAAADHAPPGFYNDIILQHRLQRR